AFGNAGVGPSGSKGGYGMASSSARNEGKEADRPIEPIRTFEQFSELFLARFRRQAEEEREEAASLWEIHQGEDQSTEDFVNEIRRKGAKIHAPDRDLITAAITGARRDIKSMFVQGHPKDLDQLVRWGTNAEKYRVKSDPEVSS